MSTIETKGASGRAVTVTAPTGGLSENDLHTLRSGTDGWVGYVRTGAAAGEDGVVMVGAQARIPKNTGSGESFDQGAKVYKDASTGDATAAATGNDYIGSASAAASTSDEFVWVMFAEAGG